MSILGKKLIGNTQDTSLESRIFHAVCIAGGIGLGLNVFYNLFLGSIELSVLLTGILIAALFIYYLSRFRKKLITAIIVFGTLSNLLLIANFYYNSGINGPSYLVFLLSIFFTVAIVPKKQYRIWIPINVLLIVGSLVIQFNYPELIINTYTSEHFRYFDIGYTYIFCMLLMLLVIYYIRNAYENERKSVKKQAEDLSASNNTKDKLLSILAHDLKDPLISIQGYLELLVEYKLDESEKLHLEQELLNKTKNTSEMLSNLLLWAKSQMDGVNVNMVSFYPKEILRNMLRTLTTAANEKGIELQNHLDDVICVSADKDMFQMVIRNLLRNAIKFTNPGGRVVIRSKREKDKCVITVKDDGLGIGADDQCDIFSLKARSTFGTGNEKGIGLGLVLCKEFTELQGGNIWFESSSGLGTTFYVSFALCPLADEAASKSFSNSTLHTELL